MVEAITYLKKFVKLAGNNFQKLDVVKASTMLGDIYNEKVSICVSRLWLGGKVALKFYSHCILTFSHMLCRMTPELWDLVDDQGSEWKENRLFFPLPPGPECHVGHSHHKLPVLMPIFTASSGPK